MNKLQIKPLREYEVFLTKWENGEHLEVSDKFTADTMLRDEDSIIFFRTGNVIRVYMHPLPNKIIVTPVDDETELPE